jgi:formimidoylglutamate deiminase
MTTLFCPELLHAQGEFQSNAGLLVGNDGRVIATGPAASFTADHVFPLTGKALLPGFVNAHSHSFQRLIRGKAESRVTSGKDFWSWRGTMYHAAAQLTLDQIYDVARMAFLEMVLSGTTTVGEFHYLHNAPGGRPYDDPNATAKQIIAAARSVGIRIVLLRSAYLRSGYGMPSDPGQVRFFETSDAFLKSMQAMVDDAELQHDAVHLGVAPHSIRAVPLEDLRKIARWTNARKLPLHMHVSEQVAENSACLQEYGTTPIALLAQSGILSERFTAVHAIHITDEEAVAMADSGASICSCPTTERNLGDGILAADKMMSRRIHICLGSDSQAQIDPLEDARELDYHLRLERQQRAILDQIEGAALANQLFDCATRNGTRALSLQAGDLVAGALGDFFTVDLKNIALAGHSSEDLLPMIVFALGRSAVRDVAVNGKLILKDQQHVHDTEIIERYIEVHRKVWSKSGRGTQ